MSGSEGAPSAAIPDPVSYSKELTGAFNGQQVGYRAIAGETYITDEKGTPVASIFTTAYLKTDVDDTSTRPVTFSYNGGPGGSSMWVHMGGFGPRRIVVPDEPENAGAPPYPIVDNPLSLLDVTDLVFIDPIGTGYSRTLGTKEPKEYWGLLEDARAIADLIQTWITTNGRWNSPKYLAGESYGTTRSALVADLLSQRFIALNGIVLISATLDFQNSRPRPGDGAILAYASFVPTYAATAWFHGKADRARRTLESFVDEARAFARTDYALALIANTRLSRDDRRKAVAGLAEYSGLTPEYVERSNLRVPVGRYFKELLRDRGLVIGRIDTRYTYVEPENAGEVAEWDPSFGVIGSAFATAIQTQLQEIGVQMRHTFQPLRPLHESWNWNLEEKTPSGGAYANVVPYLGRAMRRNTELRVLVTSGYYDLATPFFGAENALSQFGLAHERIAYKYYEVGHMIFLHEPSRLRFSNDIREFIRAGEPSTNSLTLDLDAARRVPSTTR